MGWETFGCTPELVGRPAHKRWSGDQPHKIWKAGRPHADSNSPALLEEPPQPGVDLRGEYRCETAIGGYLLPLLGKHELDELPHL